MSLDSGQSIIDELSGIISNKDTIIRNNESIISDCISNKDKAENDLIKEKGKVKFLSKILIPSLLINLFLGVLLL
jgi:hypothetical protein